MGSQLIDQNFLDQIDTLIKNYDIESAKGLLGKLVIKDVPTNKRAPLARLARRAGDFSLGVKLLNDNVFNRPQPDPQDLLEYIGCIRRLGLIHQSLQLLSRIEPSIDASINEAFCRIQLWDYKAASEVLGQLLDRPDLSPTQKNIVDINYIASLEAIDDLDQAGKLLDRFLPEVKESYPHLYLNGLNLKGKVEFKRGEYDQCIKTLTEALESGGEKNFHYSLLVQKWLWLAKLYSGQQSPQDKDFKEFMQNVRKNKVWEILRDLDWRVGKLTSNEKLVNHSYFGSPFEPFKKMIREETGQKFNRTYTRQGRAESSDEAFDFMNAKSKAFPFGKDIHRLLLILCSDFYQPWTVFRIFTYLYPREIYDPSQSQNKVYRLIGRLEKVLKTINLQECLESTPEGYRLRPHERENFLIFDKMVFGSRESLMSYKLRLSGMENSFDAQDVRDALNLSQSQMYRVLNSLQEGGFIENIANSSTMFKLK